MRLKQFTPMAIIIVIAVVLFLSYQLSRSSIISGILPTQTSIFTGPVINSTLIAELKKPQWDGKINREQAIGLTELYCAQTHSLPMENPSNIEASLMTEKEAQDHLKGDSSGTSNKPVWLVSMDGLWEHEGPITENETVVPILFTHCDVIIDAKSGEMMRLQSSHK